MFPPLRAALFPCDCRPFRYTDALKTQVYITVDTENSMGGAWARPEVRPVPSDRRVFCRINGTDHGIGWQCDELARRGMRASFFCEVLSSFVLGEDDTRAYVDYLLQRGQDVQLHTHPTFWFYSRYLAAKAEGREFDHSERSDKLARLPEPTQRFLLEQACAVFKRFTGRSPAAYRAGGYQANTRSLAILRELGIVLDTSFNPAYQGQGSFDGENLTPNVPQQVAGLWEIPVTVAIENLPDPRKPTRFMPFEISAISVPEMRGILDHAHQAGMEHVVVMFHSFSGVKPKDDQHTAMRPDSIVRSRFTQFLDHLARNSARFEVSTFGDLAARLPSLSAREAVPMPELGYGRPFVRKAVQLLNHWYWL